MLRRSVSASVRPLSACAPSTVSQVIVVDVERRKGGVEAQCLRQRPLIMTWERRSLCSLFSQLQCPPSLPSPYLSWCHGCSDAPSWSPRRGRRGLSTDARALPLSLSTQIPTLALSPITLTGFLSLALYPSIALVGCITAPHTGQCCSHYSRAECTVWSALSASALSQPCALTQHSVHKT